MHITGKGQVTIPVDIRREFGFLPHTNIDFIVRGKDVILRKADKAKKSPFYDLLGCATNSMTTDEIMYHTRNDE